MFGTEIEHLLGFADTADHRPGQRAPAVDQRGGPHGRGRLGHADQHHAAVAPEQLQVGVVIVYGRDRVQEHVELLRMLPEHRLVAGRDKCVGAQLQRIVALVRRMAEHAHVRAHGLGQLHAHVPEPAQADHAHPAVGPDVEAAQWRIGGDAGAQQRGGAGRVQVFGHAQQVVLVHHDAGGIAAVGRAPAIQLDAVAFVTVVGEACACGAELFLARTAGLALTAGIDEATHADPVAVFPARDPAPERRHLADDLVARHQWENRVSPLVAYLMQVRVAHTAVTDVDLDVMRPGGPAFDRERSEWSVRRARGVGRSGHGNLMRRSGGDRSG